VNNKNLDISDFSQISPYPEYEQINISSIQAQNLLSDFNKAMNNQMSMPNMEIKQALLAMEMYFNYAIVDKNKDYDVKTSYQEQSFEFTVNVDDNTISGEELKTNYRQFLIGIKNEMSNKFLKFSNLFVSSKTDNTITFKIIIPPYLDGLYSHDAAAISIPSCPVVREVGEIPNVPVDEEIDWSIYFANYPPLAPMDNFPYFWNNPQEILESYCLKPLEYFVYGITEDNIIDYDRWDLSNYYFITNTSFLSRNTTYFNCNHIFNNQEIMNYLIPTTLAEADELRQNIQGGKYLLDISIDLNFPYYWDMNYTIIGGCLTINKYKTGYLIPWIELNVNIDDILFVG
jgi:hypothetical protein